ncbi:hypothetical protein [Nocardia transvalensis]|uniref:hypothetical protein n=1 Tax=Nocardia transvalensis TaxID=37333 RepID=UPI0018940813|nr:hypothetical protein [Nocardia transvalensis]MBF6332454.1 hypothetical protein [Nocardia transvalensis]
MPTPCQAHPQAWLQPGEDPFWHLSSVTRWAAAQCRNACPDQIPCAKAALTAGNLDGDDTPYVASGVVMGGVICDGGANTRRQLLEIADPASLTRPARPPNCVICRRPMTTRRKPSLGEVRHESKGRCARCVRTQKRASA